jgi:hypothetical protein
MMSIKSKQRISGLTGVFFICFLLSTQLLTFLMNPYSESQAIETLLTQGSDEADLIWFAQITDVHVGSRESTPHFLTKFLEDLNDYVHPAFVVSTGDHVEGDYNLREVWAYPSEWILYDEVISSVAGNLNYDYYDLPGNHDNWDNNNLSLFRQYSHIGKEFNAIHTSWTIRKADSSALFVGISTADIVGGESPISHEGRITESELNYLKAELEPSADAKIVFSHHSPVETDLGYTIRETPEKDELMELLKTSGVMLYANGHRHKERFLKGDGTLFLTADNWPHFRLCAIDLKRGQSSSFDYYANPITWPLILPVFPVNSSQAIKGQKKLSPEFSLEVLVFSRGDIERVSIDPGTGNWLDLTRAGTYLWRLSKNADIQPINDTIKIRASDQLGRRRDITLTVENWQDETRETKESSIDFFILFSMVAITVPPLLFERRKRRYNS